MIHAYKEQRTYPKCNFKSKFVNLSTIHSNVYFSVCIQNHKEMLGISNEEVLFPLNRIDSSFKSSCVTDSKTSFKVLNSSHNNCQK